MKLLVIAILCVASVSCGNRFIYDTLQQDQNHQCVRAGGSVLECQEDDQSYREYKNERDKLLKESS